MGNTTGNTRETLERAARLLSRCVEQLAGQSPELAEQVASLAGGVFDVSACASPSGARALPRRARHMRLWTGCWAWCFAGRWSMQRGRDGACGWSRWIAVRCCRSLMRSWPCAASWPRARWRGMRRCSRPARRPKAPTMPVASESSLTVSSTACAPSSHQGRAKRPRKSLLVRSTRPVPSKCSTLARRRHRPTKRKTSPLSSCWPNCCSTRALNPSKPRRMSTGTAYAKTRTARVSVSTPAPLIAARRSPRSSLRCASRPAPPAPPAALPPPRLRRDAG